MKTASVTKYNQETITRTTEIKMALQFHILLSSFYRIRIHRDASFKQSMDL